MLNESVRIQKYLSSLGIGSRRKIEAWVEEGRIKVNGQIAKAGDRVNEKSRISIDGKPIRRKPVDSKSRVIIYNKPEGEICTRSDPKNRPTVFKKLPILKNERWVAVGRLDINTRGLILFTNDGALANQLMHPSSNIEREYMCRIFGKVDEGKLNLIKDGVMVDGKKLNFLNVKRQRGEGKNTWYSVTVGEGIYREVRRIWEAVDCQVSRLIRIRYGNVELPTRLRQGEWSELKPSMVSGLQTAQPVQETENKSTVDKPKNKRDRKRSTPGRNNRIKR